MIRTIICSAVRFQLGRSTFAAAALLVPLGVLVLVLVLVALRMLLLLLLLLLLRLTSDPVGATRPICLSYALVVCSWVIATIIVEMKINRD